MIEKLTPEQEALLPVYRDKWIKIGLSTEPFTMEEARTIINNLYTHILQLTPPAHILMAENPADAWVIASKNEDIKAGDTPDLSIDPIKDRHYMKDFVWPYLDGQFWAGYLSFYDFVFSELIPCDNPNWPYLRDTSKLSLIYSLDNICVLSQKPQEINLKDGVLHKDGGAAIKYGGVLDCNIYALNGVVVPDWLALEPSGNIDPAKIGEISNVEVRREFLRKVGLERIKYKLGAKILDAKTYNIGGHELPYELLEMQLGATTCRALQMQNPSIDATHVEFVPMTCKTILEAWNFRTGLDKYKIDDTTGVDWYLHGDVVVIPKGAKVVKQFPCRIA